MPKSTKNILSIEEKKKLAKLIEPRPCLWNKHDESYKRSDIVLINWKAVAKAMSISVAECKNGWKSMKDALRYRKSAKPKGKSGDAASVASDGEEENEEQRNKNNTALDAWDLWESIKFYAEKPDSYSAVSSMKSEVENLPVQIRNIDEDSSLNNSRDANAPEFAPSTNENLEVESNYKNVVPSKKRKLSDPSSADKLCEGISDLINLRKEQASRTTSDLKYASMYGNLDRMLRQLPEDVVEDLNLQFITMTHTALKSLL